jgi:tRNA threonylcarbamoyladenosine biosynthesis protein TsaB
LLALAERAWRERGCERGLVCADAHMGEVYWAEFTVEREVVRLVGPERLGVPAEVAAPTQRRWCAVGNGFAAHSAALADLTESADCVAPQLMPTAADLLPQARRDLAAGRTAPAEAALPVYLREHTAWRRTS